MRHCPYCNNDVIDGRCSNASQCDYKGPGLTTQERHDQYVAAGSPKLGDTTGEPRNNGWADGSFNQD